jgi:hypothetical protein
MNFYTILAIFVISTLVVFTVNLTSAQVDPLVDIVFLQTGELNTSENQFHISNEMSIREFFNGNIIRVSGQTIEGFPYITYSKISDDKIDTHGMIFISSQFVDLTFVEKDSEKESVVEKQDNLSIIVKYSQRVYSKESVSISIKIFDPIKNKLNDFYQNYGMISNTQIQVTVMDNNIEIFSGEGTTNENGLFEIGFITPADKVNTYAVTINAENENSMSTKILQIFNLGTSPKDRSD